jgi:hypothetical protein
VPLFRISVLNETFSACGEHELATASDAKTEGIKGALAMGSDEVSKGKQYFGAEVKIEEGDELVGCFVVSVGASPIENAKQKPD